MEPESESQESNPEGAQIGGRRAKKSVNYALPNLREYVGTYTLYQAGLTWSCSKMRQPAGYVPQIKKAARHSHSIAGNGSVAASSTHYNHRLSSTSEPVDEEEGLEAEA